MRERFRPLRFIEIRRARLLIIAQSYRPEKNMHFHESPVWLARIAYDRQVLASKSGWIVTIMQQKPPRLYSSSSPTAPFDSLSLYGIIFSNLQQRGHDISAALRPAPLEVVSRTPRTEERVLRIADLATPLSTGNVFRFAHCLQEMSSLGMNGRAASAAKAL
ncbi:hypothetical protein DPSP01_013090 [Paraphaeosphaeria sporulosa]